MNFLFDFIKGIFIGAGAILPGISSGVLCVVFGIYEKLLNSVLDFFKAPIKNLKYLLPIIFGGIIGVLIVSKLLIYLFNNFNSITCFCFIGLILGSIPSILKQAKLESTNSNNKILNYLFLLLTLSFSMFLVAMETLNENAQIFIENAETPNTLKLFYSGLLMSAGVVIPGVSSSIILMILGIYNIYLQAISSLNLFILIPMGIGLLIGGFVFLKIIQFLFKHYKAYTYYAITGFTLGSIFVLFPGIEFSLYGFLSIIFCVLCFFIANSFEKIGKN